MVKTAVVSLPGQCFDSTAFPVIGQWTWFLESEYRTENDYAQIPKSTTTWTATTKQKTNGTKSFYLPRDDVICLMGERFLAKWVLKLLNSFWWRGWSKVGIDDLYEWSSFCHCSPNPALPQTPCLPPSRSGRPYTTYELDQMRQIHRGWVKVFWAIYFFCLPLFPNVFLVMMLKIATVRPNAL